MWSKIVLAAFCLLLAHHTSGLPGLFSLDIDTAVPWRPWEEAEHAPSFVEGESQVFDWFVSQLKNTKSWAQREISMQEDEAQRLKQDENLNHVLPDRYFSFIPPYVASIIPGANAVTWSSSCFKKNEASVTPSKNGLTVKVIATEPSSKMCSDLYLYLTTEGLHFQKIFKHGEHTINWKFSKKISDDERAWIGVNGIRVFRFEDTIPNLLLDLLSTIELFSPVIIPSPSVPEFAAKANLKFIKDYANVTMEKREIENVDLDESLLGDGDFLAIIRLDGLDTMQVFGTGAHTGHTATILKMEGEVFVVESTDKTSYWPKGKIQRTKYSEWIKLARKADYNVRHIPLSAEARGKFDSAAAVKYFKSVEGAPYGYHNFIWGWVDTADHNLPHPLSRQLVEPLFALVAKIEPAIAVKMWELAFNFRLGTKDLSTAQIYSTLIHRNLSFADIITMPEQDSWVYPDGPSMVCDVLVCAIYKAAGLFGPLADQIQCTEFQNWDVETLAFFDRNYTLPPQCAKADPMLSSCQIMGKYRMHLPGVGTVTPYPHMREKCGAEPPLFEREPMC